MIWINFEKWSMSLGNFWKIQRIYWNWKWTPFVWITPRYLGKQKIKSWRDRKKEGKGLPPYQTQ